MQNEKYSSCFFYSKLFYPGPFPVDTRRRFNVYNTEQTSKNIFMFTLLIVESDQVLKL